MSGKKWVSVFLLIFFFIGFFQFIFVSLFRDSFIKKMFESSQTYSDAKFVLDNHLFPKYVFMGSSMSRHSIIPKIISSRLNIDNDKVVNIGMNAATPYEMYLSYKKSQKNFSNVDTYFYTLEPFVFQRGYFVHKKFEKLLWTYSEWKFFSAQRNISNNYFNKLSLLINAFGRSRSAISEDNGYMKLECKKYDKYTKERLMSTFTDIVNSDYGISEFQLAYLKRLKDEVESNGARFVVVYVPNHYSYYEVNVKYNQVFNGFFERRMNEVVGSAIQIGFFNQNSISLLDSDFMDAHHLCHSGAEKFSIYLSGLLSNIGKLHPTPIQLPFN